MVTTGVDSPPGVAPGLADEPPPGSAPPRPRLRTRRTPDDSPAAAATSAGGGRRTRRSRLWIAARIALVVALVAFLVSAFFAFLPGDQSRACSSAAARSCSRCATSPTSGCPRRDRATSRPTPTSCGPSRGVACGSTTSSGRPWSPWASASCWPGSAPRSACSTTACPIAARPASSPSSASALRGCRPIRGTSRSYRSTTSVGGCPSSSGTRSAWCVAAGVGALRAAAVAVPVVGGVRCPRSVRAGLDRGRPAAGGRHLSHGDARPARRRRRSRRC